MWSPIKAISLFFSLLPKVHAFLGAKYFSASELQSKGFEI